VAGVVARFVSFRSKDRLEAEAAAKREATSGRTPIDLLGVVAEAQVAAGHPKCVRLLGLQQTPSTTLVASIVGDTTPVLAEVVARVPATSQGSDGSWLLHLDDKSPAVARLVVESVDTLPTSIS
jgi:hypothetical protein